MDEYEMSGLRLDLFGGEAADPGPAEGSGADAAPLPVETGRETGEGEARSAAPVPEEDGPDAGGEEKEDGAAAEAGPPSENEEERRRAFRALVNGKYKDLFTEETQRIIDRRFRKARRMEAQLRAQQPVIDLLRQRHKAPEGDMEALARAIESDESFWRPAADEAGMSVEQYRRLRLLEQENERLLRDRQERENERRAQAQLRRWDREADEVRRRYPDFDLGREAENGQFLSLLRSGVPMERAYTAVHLDEIVARAAAEAEKRVVASVRAKGARPAENGTAARSAFTVRDDVSRLSRQERAELARRAAMGETIRF